MISLGRRRARKDKLRRDTIEAVSASGLFDARWYVDHYPEVVAFKAGPLAHFCEYGMRERRDPGPNFSTDKYLRSVPEAARGAVPPFLHALANRSAGSEAAWLPDDLASLKALLVWSGLFDAEWYLDRYRDVARAGLDPLAHFAEYGAPEPRDPGPNFDARAYAARYPDYAETARSPVEHFIRYGRARGNVAEPVAVGADAGAAWGSDRREALKKLLIWSGLFDGRWYLNRYRDVARAGIDPLTHFLDYGAPDLRDPGPGFDAAFYAEEHPEFREACGSPIEHYLRFGRARGHAPEGPPLYARWIARHDVLTRADLERIRADADGDPAGPVAIVHVLDGEACADLDRVLGALREQPGSSIAHLLRGPGVPDETWAGCAAAAASAPGIACHDAPDGVLDGLPDGTTLLVCAGAVLLRPHAAYLFAGTLRRQGVSAAYADHDRIGPDGTRTEPAFKPAMSPEYMRRVPYAGPVAAIRLDGETRARAREAIASACRGAADPARCLAALILDLDRTRVARVPFILYHLAGDPAPVAGAPPPAPPALPDPPPTVRLIIPTRDRVGLLRAGIDSILADTDYPRERYEIAIVDNASREAATLAYLRDAERLRGVRVVPSPGPFNFSKVCNDGAAGTTAEILVFLNNDMTVRQRDWLRKLVEQAVQPDVGVVGAQLLYPDDTIQHGGVVLGVQGVGAHRLVGVEAAEAAETDVTREMTSVTGACLALRRCVFHELGGFDPVLEIAFNDVKLCASAARAGYRNIYVAEPLLYHHESQSRGFDDTREKLWRNNREAIYVRARFAELFQDDPSYSPNLSLQTIDAPAFPPRVVRPWRRSGERPRVLILSCVHGLGHGVPAVIAQQAAFLRARGWDVVVGGPLGDRDIAYPGCRRVALSGPAEAAALAVSEGIDCVLAHTPPFFSIVRFLGRRPLVYFVDHGEPDPALFADHETREGTDWEKRLCAPCARRVFTISRAVHDQQFRKDAIVVRNGNAHLSVWSERWAAARPDLRGRHGLDGRFVVLNVCRFQETERTYKGIDRYAAVAREAPYLHPELKERTAFVLAGRGDPADAEHVRAAGIEVFANPSDETIRELYAASDLYVSLSRWEGYNLGIGQALAMGLDVVASDIPAHREFGIPVSNDVPALCGMLAERHAAWREAAARREAAAGRRAVIEDWARPLTRLAETIEADLERARDTWF